MPTPQNLFERLILQRGERKKGLPFAGLLSKWPQWSELSPAEARLQELIRFPIWIQGSKELHSSPLLSQAVSRAGSEVEQT